MADAKTYELQSLGSHGQSLSQVASKDYEAVPGTPSKDDLLAPSRRMSQSPPPHTTSMPSSSYRFYDAFNVVRSLLLPLVAIAYLAFCYTVHNRAVPLKTRFFDSSPDNLAVIKSGVTSISIVIITIGLFPIQVLISDLRSEEFFRVVTTTATGAPLYSINSISSPSFGLLESLIVVFRRHCSPYFIVAVITALLTFVTATLAPAALSVNTALFDDQLIALAVGGIRRDEVLNVSSILPEIIQSNVEDLFPKAATLTWVENLLGVPYGFAVSNGPHYMVPTPLNLQPTVPARWLSDVAIMDPQCEWGNGQQTFFGTDPVINQTILVTHFRDQTMNLTFNVQSSLFDDSVINIAAYNSMVNLTDQGLLASGAMLITLAQCTSGCAGFDQFVFDLSGLPVVNVTKHNSNASLPDMTFDLSFLICDPHIDLETREVRNDGHGMLTVGDVNYPVRQGNLDPTQTNLLFSNILSRISDGAGPAVAQIPTLGSEGLAVLLFGPNATNVTRDDLHSLTVKPAPIANITDTYTHMLQSASKIFFNGAISTAYVPARLSTQQIVFTSSLPQVIVSTILFVLLCAIAGAAHFRNEIPKFSLFSVASSLDGSDVPRTLGQVRNDADPRTRESDMLASLGRRSVVAGMGESGPVLHLQ
ncbi:hypothetical protein EIP91_011305 [Steccherinum ochraceum]|uniref:Uncharacterized protein n=1 Tax=Steccherinum ochraceum TaxID=92696 RepID=A0A4R0RL06_9APHY|nr:hypothetical protein EIP91_011305 [Steccherinum ochraceum]